MRTFVFALAVLVTASAVDRAEAADEPPTFDIARNCKLETTGAITGAAPCVKDETDAKDQLTQRWSSFGASQKRDCIGESSTGGEKSYVELLSCLEMSTGQFSPRGDDPKR